MEPLEPQLITISAVDHRQPRPQDVYLPAAPRPRSRPPRRTRHMPPMHNLRKPQAATPSPYGSRSASTASPSWNPPPPSTPRSPPSSPMTTPHDRLLRYLQQGQHCCLRFPFRSLSSNPMTTPQNRVLHRLHQGQHGGLRFSFRSLSSNPTTSLTLFPASSAAPTRAGRKSNALSPSAPPPSAPILGIV